MDKSIALVFFTFGIATAVGARDFTTAIIPGIMLTMGVSMLVIGSLRKKPPA